MVSLNTSCPLPWERVDRYDTNLPKLTKRYRLLVPVLFALAVPVAGLAQSARSSDLPRDDADDEAPVYLSPFEVSSERASAYRVTDSIGGSRIRRALIDTPATINVITSEFLSDLGASSIIEATQYLSGVTYGALGGVGGIFDRQVMRGFEVYGNTIDNFTLGGIQASLDPVIIERVEILKGPNALLSPSGAPGGTSNIITKSPKFEQASELKAEYASRFYGNKTSFDSTGPIPGTEHFAYRVVGSYQDADGFVPGKIHNQSVHPMLTWAISPKTQLKLKGTFINWKQTGSVAANQHNLHFRDDLPQGATVGLGDIKPGYVYGGPNGQADWNERSSNVVRGVVEFTSALTDNINLRLASMRNYYHFYSDGGGLSIYRPGAQGKNHINPMTGEYTPLEHWDLQDPSRPWDVKDNPYVSSPTDFTPSGAWLDEDYGHTWINNVFYQGDLAGAWDFGRVATFHVVTGVAYSAKWRHVKGWTSPREPVDNWDLSKPYVDRVPRPRTIPELSVETKKPREKVTQLYINTQLDFFKGRLIFSGGVSHQKRTAPGEVNLFENTVGKGLDGSKNSPSYAVLYKVKPWASVYASHGRNAESTDYNDGSQTHILWREGKQDEVGVKMEFFDRRLSVTSAYFGLEQTNFVTEHPDRWFNPKAPDQLASVTNEGFELDIMGQVTSNLTVVASYTDMALRDALGRPRMGIPDNMANALVKYGFADGPARGLSVFVGVNYVGKQAGENPKERTEIGVAVPISFWMPSRTIYNAGASYDYGSLRFQLNVENVFDKKTLWQPGGRNQLTAFPGANVRLTTTYSF